MNEALKRDQFREIIPVQTSEQHLLRFAETLADFIQVEEVWREVYCKELGWLNERHCNPHDDQYHLASKYVIARTEAKEVVGVMRLVFNSDAGLPIEQFTDIGALKRRCQGRIIECARLMVPKRCRDMRIDGYPFGIYAALVKATLHYCLSQGIYDVVVNCFKHTETTPIKSLLQLGFRDLGVEFHDELNEGSVCTALHLDIRDMLANMYASRKKFTSYMVAHDELFHIYN